MNLFEPGDKVWIEGKWDLYPGDVVKVVRVTAYEIIDSYGSKETILPENLKKRVSP